MSIKGIYTNTMFHRVVPNFVIQGGGFDTDYKLESRRPPRCQRVRQWPEQHARHRGHGAQPGAARRRCQFYVNLFDNAALDPNQTRWGYAVFGKVIQGMEVVDKSATSPPARTGRSRKMRR